MKRLSLALVTCLLAAGCTYRPAPTDPVRIVDTPADLRVCKRLADISGQVATTGGFGGVTRGMLEATVAVGGTDLLPIPVYNDWSVVRAAAYRCPVTGSDGW